MKSFKKTFVFALIVCALGVFTYLEFQKSKDEKEQKAIEAKVFGEILPGDIKGVVIQLPNEKIQLQKSGDTWKTVAPLDDEGDSPSIVSYISSILGQTVSQVKLEGEANWQQYGLQAANNSITLETVGGAAEKVFVNINKLYDGSIYLRREGSAKLLIGQGKWLSFLQKSVNDFRNKQIFPKREEILSIQSKWGDTNFELVKDDKKTWKIQGHEDWTLSTAAVEEYVRALKDTRVAEFVNENPKSLKAYDLNSPFAEILVKFKSGPWKVSLSKEKDGHHFAKTSQRETIYKYRKSALNKWDKKPEDFKLKEKPKKSEDKNKKMSSPADKDLAKKPDSQKKTK